MGNVVVATSHEQLTRQYGTLRNAVLVYLRGRMPDEQAAGLERVVAPEFISAVAQVEFARTVSEALRLFQG